MKKKPLLDIVQMLFPDKDRERLLAYILSGNILVDGQKNLNPKDRLPLHVKIELRKSEFVSRGGYKLEYALESWELDVKGKVMLDAGSSSGGFTDCLLKHGALLVHAVDVGYNQIDFLLRKNAAVKVYEKCNIMQCKEFFPQPDGAVADLSFRSISGVAAHILRLVREKWLVALIKPQFELKRGRPGFKGVIRDREMMEEAILPLIESLWYEGSYVQRVSLSPLRGRKGNYEFLFLIDSSCHLPKSSILEKLNSLFNNLDFKETNSF